MSQVRERRNYENEYVNGNTVRQVQPERRGREYTDVRPDRRNESRVRSNERSVLVNAPYVLFLAAVSAVCLIMCVTYLNIQSEITQTRESISQLKTEISTVQSQNDALQYSINSNVDADNIYKTAVNDLGMVQASDNQISMYESSDSGYTIQYGDIPTE